MRQFRRALASLKAGKAAQTPAFSAEGARSGGHVMFDAGLQGPVAAHRCVVGVDDVGADAARGEGLAVVGP
jgi:hypothetical protein